MGTVFDIKRFAVHDGPGIRTTVHLKGCPLNCIWCHNPEGIHPDPVFSVRKVKLDGQNFTIEEQTGKEYSATELFNEIMKDQIFWQESGGGVTFSGGEPLLQSDFLIQLLRLLKEQKVHTVVDTSAFTSTEQLTEISPLVDLFLIDLKVIDDELHREFTGVSNQIILRNIDWLIANNHRFRIRIPVIPNKNFNPESLNHFISYLKKKQITELDLLPYHAIARGKYKRFAIKNKMGETDSLSQNDLVQWKKKLEENNFKVGIGG